MLTSDQRGLALRHGRFCGGLLSENQKCRTRVRTTEIIITGKQSRSIFDKNTNLFYSQIKINNTLLKFLPVRRNRTCSSLSREAVHLQVHREIVAIVDDDRAVAYFLTVGGGDILHVLGGGWVRHKSARAPTRRAHLLTHRRLRRIATRRTRVHEASVREAEQPREGSILG